MHLPESRHHPAHEPGHSAIRSAALIGTLALAGFTSVAGGQTIPDSATTLPRGNLPFAEYAYSMEMRSSKRPTL